MKPLLHTARAAAAIFAALFILMLIVGFIQGLTGGA